MLRRYEFEVTLAQGFNHKQILRNVAELYLDWHLNAETLPTEMELLRMRKESTRVKALLYDLGNDQGEETPEEPRKRGLWATFKHLLWYVFIAR